MCLKQKGRKVLEDGDWRTGWRMEKVVEGWRMERVAGDWRTGLEDGESG
jgi:hypothetical protein